MSTGRRRILLAHVTPHLPGTPQRATWSPTDKHESIALSGGNLVATKSTESADPFAGGNVRATSPMVRGQWYWETISTFGGGADVVSGIAASYQSLSNPLAGVADYPYAIAVDTAGSLLYVGHEWANVGALASGDIIRHWLDMDAGIYRVARNDGEWAVFDNPAPFALWKEVFPACGIFRPAGGNGSCSANFGATPFAYALPSGANPGVYTLADPEAVTLYLSSETFTDVDRQYDARIAGDDAADVVIERQGSCYVWGSQSVSRRGSIQLINADGALDAWADYDWRDATVELYSGYEGESILDFRLWSFNRVDSIAYNESLRVELALADPLALLDRPLQTRLYPVDQANAQAAGKPLPIVFGAPLYCSGVRLDTAASARDYQLDDTGLVEITDVYDNGDRFGGPGDAFVALNPITGTNGGDFTGWSGTPSVPAGWTALTPYGATTDRFMAGVPAGLRAQSHHNPSTVIQHSAQLQENTRYQITFNVAGVPTPGTLTLAVGAVTYPCGLSSATLGARSATIDVAAAGPLELRLDGTPLDVTITQLRAASVQVIDWTYYEIRHGDLAGFTLENQPAGKVVANPVSPVDTLGTLIDNVCNARLALPDAGNLPAVDFGTVDAVETAAPYVIARYVDTPVTALVLLREAMDSWCGWITSNRLGQIVVGRVEAPANDAALTLDTTNILGEIRRTDDVAKGLTLRLGGRRNNSPHSDGEIADSVTPAMRAELQAELTIVRAGAAEMGDGAVSPAYAQAVNADVRATLLQLDAHLQAEANRIATLWRPNRHFYACTALLDASTSDELEPGQTVRLVWPRYGLSGGRNLFVVGVVSRFFDRRVDLLLWGD